MDQHFAICLDTETGIDLYFICRWASRLERLIGSASNPTDSQCNRPHHPGAGSGVTITIPEPHVASCTLCNGVPWSVHTIPLKIIKTHPCCVPVCPGPRRIVCLAPQLRRPTLYLSFDPWFKPGTMPSRRWLVQTDGKVILGGYFTTVHGMRCASLARFEADGAVDTSFKPVIAIAAGRPWVGCVTVLSDSKLLIGGDFTSVNGVTRTNLGSPEPGWVLG